VGLVECTYAAYTRALHVMDACTMYTQFGSQDSRSRDSVQGHSALATSSQALVVPTQQFQGRETSQNRIFLRFPTVKELHTLSILLQPEYDQNQLPQIDHLSRNWISRVNELCMSKPMVDLLKADASHATDMQSR
jgi:hypothetical protein